MHRIGLLLLPLRRCSMNNQANHASYITFKKFKTKTKNTPWNDLSEDEFHSVVSVDLLFHVFLHFPALTQCSHYKCPQCKSLLCANAIAIHKGPRHPIRMDYCVFMWFFSRPDLSFTYLLLYHITDVHSPVWFCTLASRQLGDVHHSFRIIPWLKSATARFRLCQFVCACRQEEWKWA